jgi:hypothetical protein
MYKVCLWRYNAILFGTRAPPFGCKLGEVFYFVLLNVTVNCHCIVSAGRETCRSAILSTTNCCHYCHATSFTPKHSYLYQTRRFTSKRMVNFMVTATNLLPDTVSTSFGWPPVATHFKICAVNLLQQMWPCVPVLHNAQAVHNKESKLIKYAEKLQS